ncbi:unnamed protein product [Schistosoma mattheei]|uniref:Uncharacterized protein n=1 Tax=Schistosoma mattheei TaxID=31246 RepID=A0A183P272_9TREM|nr:unnamed protein product [Schistosoma mattheei]
MTAEKASGDENMRELSDITKNHSENHRKPKRPVKSKESKAAPTDLPIDAGPPTIEEISMAIRQIKSGKAAGQDNIPAEALKADVAGTARILHILFNEIWDEEQVPKDWKEGLLIKIPKEGDLSKCYQQAGFRKDRSCTDQIATPRIIV